MLVKPPPEEEISEYYHGLPSHPRLVARSDAPTAKWSPREMPYPEWPTNISKYLSNVGNHKIVKVWSANGGELRELIIQEANKLDWCAIDIFRIGYHENECYPGDHLNRPVVLFITLDTDRNTWEEAYAVAMKCKEIMEAKKVADVHCEIKKGKLLSTATAPVSVPQCVRKLNPLPQSEKLRWPSHVERKIPLSECIGASISLYERPRETGTKGPYLRLRHDSEEDRIVMLTCQHVVSPSNNGQASYSGRIVQMPYRGYWPLHDKLERELQSLLHEKEGEDRVAEQLKGDLTDLDKARIAKLDRKINVKKHQITHLDAEKGPESCVIGHILSAPPCGLQSTHGRLPWWRDWALIELNQEKHETSLTRLSNQVPVTHSPMHWFHPSNEEKTNILKQLGPAPMITLSGMLPEATIANPPDAQGLIVSTFTGGGKDIRFGTSNEIMSVTCRRSNNGKKLVSDEWGITGIGREAFSADGDSGACVWDVHSKCIAGMITSGSGDMLSRSDICGRNYYYSAIDVTYATPIERLIEDMRDCGLDVSLL